MTVIVTRTTHTDTTLIPATAFQAAAALSMVEDLPVPGILVHPIVDQVMIPEAQIQVHQAQTKPPELNYEPQRN